MGTERALLASANYLAGLRHGFAWGFLLGFAFAMTLLAVVAIITDAAK